MKPLFKTKRMLTATLLALVMMVAVGATLALMASTSNSVTNTFAAAQVDTEIEEDGLDMGNKEVAIVNNGKSPVYVRARIMVSGVDPDNIVIADESDEYTYNEDTDEYGIKNPEAGKLYLIMPNVTEDWEQATGATGKDDYYYYKKVLPGKEEDGTTNSTSSLLEKVVVGSGLATQLKEDPNFSVTVYHESVLAINTNLTTISGENDIDEAFENAKTR